MPVTVRLSRKFYEKFGEDVANELVNLLNSVDSPSRAELRDQNESNFVRFDAKLEQRLAEADARLERRLGELDTRWERRLSELDTRWERRLAESDTHRGGASCGSRPPPQTKTANGKRQRANG